MGVEYTQAEGIPDSFCRRASCAVPAPLLAPACMCRKNEGPCGASERPCGAELDEAAGYKKDWRDEISNAMKLDEAAGYEHKADRGSMFEAVKLNGHALRDAAPELSCYFGLSFLHAVIPHLCSVLKKQGKYRGGWNSKAAGRCYDIA